MTTFILNAYEQTYILYGVRRHYTYDNSLAIELVDSKDEQSFAILTVNLSDALEEVMEGIPLPHNVQAVDVNNCPWAEDFIKDNNLGKPLGVYITSGFCTYPLYIFDLDKLVDIGE